MCLQHRAAPFVAPWQSFAIQEAQGEETDPEHDWPAQPGTHPEREERGRGGADQMLADSMRLVSIHGY